MQTGVHSRHFNCRGMTITIKLADANGGTELVAIHDGSPPAYRPRQRDWLAHGTRQTRGAHRKAQLPARCDPVSWTGFIYAAAPLTTSVATARIGFISADVGREPAGQGLVNLGPRTPAPASAHATAARLSRTSGRMHVLVATGSLAASFFILRAAHVCDSKLCERGHSKSEINDRVHTILEVGGCKALQSPEVLGYSDTAEAQNGQKRSGMMRARSPN